MNPSFFTFYSYKGGSGRTTTLMNVAKHLADIKKASKKNPILLIDADLESAGLTYFFNCQNKFTARLSYTIHTEAFLNNSEGILKGINGDNTFCCSREEFISCDKLATRIANLFCNHANNITESFKNVSIRQTTYKIFERIISAYEICSNEDNFKKMDKTNDNDDYYFFKTYSLLSLIGKIQELGKDDSFECAEQKRKIIENFLPTDGMIDVSEYFGLSEGTVMFIGADVAFTKEHCVFDAAIARRNKTCIKKECAKHNFSTIFFDCGAGVQSTAHVLNHISDNIVYCMRPTFQFISGTGNQLINYSKCLGQIAENKQNQARSNGEPCDKKSVILLPTAVPNETIGTKELQNDSFNGIKTIYDSCNNFIDNTFCSYENALKEVGLFRWREHILGAPIINISSKTTQECIETLNVYTDYATMPDDAKAAYKVYRHIAERLIYNS